jgi:hypothetical protein
MEKIKELMDVPLFVGQKIVVKKMNSGELSDIRDYALEIKVKETTQGNKPEINTGLSLGKLKHYGLAVGIIEAPFFVNADGSKIIDVDKRYEILRKLESETTDYVNEKLNELNTKKISDEIIKK